MMRGAGALRVRILLHAGVLLCVATIVDACSGRGAIAPPVVPGSSLRSDTARRVAHHPDVSSSPTPSPSPTTTPSPSPQPTASPPPTATPTPPPKIQHIVIIIQENRSFDNLFQGYPGANTVPGGLTSNGTYVPLQPVSMAAPYDNGHGAGDFAAAYDYGEMDGFNLERSMPLPGYTAPPNQEYGYTPQTESKPLWNLASQYVLGDYMFASNLDSSFVAHQYLIAGQASRAVNNPTFQPWGCDSPSNNLVWTLNSDRTYGAPTYPCFDYPTLADELDARGFFWRFYAPTINTYQRYHATWSPFDAIRHIRNGPDWSVHMSSPETNIYQDLANGYMASVTWVVPSLANSDHATSQSNTGPAWVVSVVNAIGQSKFWDTTAILITWDDWGGWYDHMPPPQLDYDGLGMRVPLIVVSPWAKQGYVSHVTYEYGSLLQYVETWFALPHLAASDARANSLLPDCFDWSPQATPRPFVPIQTYLQPKDFIQRSRTIGGQPDTE
jgi:phospholipase C